MAEDRSAAEVARDLADAFEDLRRRARAERD